MKTAFISFVLILLQIPSYASQEAILQPHEVQIAVDAGSHFGNVILEVNTRKENAAIKISGIRLNVQNEWKEVPEKAFIDLENPRLNQLQIRTESGRDGTPWLYIYFELFKKDELGQFNLHHIHICYHKDRFESRSIDRETKPGEFQSESIEL